MTAGGPDRLNAARMLEAKFRADIPLSGAMDVRVQAFDGDRLTLTAPLAPNVNVHGTGFAGSIYALAALCGWGLIFLRLRELGSEGNLVLTEASVRYARPMTSELVAVCDVSASPQFAASLEKYQRTGHARLELLVVIGDPQAPAAEIRNQYFVRRNAVT